MTWQDLRNINPLITRGLNETIEHNEEARAFVTDCLIRYLNGEQGATCEEDQQANLAELAAGYGRIVTKWKRPANAHALGLRDNLFIITYFDKDYPGDIEYNNTTIMYCDEY